MVASVLQAIICCEPRLIYDSEYLLIILFTHNDNSNMSCYKTILLSILFQSVDLKKHQQAGVIAVSTGFCQRQSKL